MGVKAYFSFQTMEKRYKALETKKKFLQTHPSIKKAIIYLALNFHNMP
jgi:hypothetical protein